MGVVRRPVHIEYAGGGILSNQFPLKSGREKQLLLSRCFYMTAVPNSNPYVHFTL